MFQMGGPVMYPLAIASFLGLAVILDRVIAFAWWYQRFPRVVNALGPLVRGGKWEEAESLCQRRGPLSRVAGIYLRHRLESKEIREDLVRREGLLVIAHLDRGLR